jgi:peroxiredoxin
MMDLQINNLRTGQRMPNLQLIDEHDRPVKISDYRQRSNLILVFSGEPPGEAFFSLLDDLAGIGDEVGAENGKVLAVTCAGPAQIQQWTHGRDLPVRYLADPNGEAHRQAGAVNRAGGPGFMAAVLDRYGEIFSLYQMNENTPPPSARALVEWLEYIELQCDE